MVPKPNYTHAKRQKEALRKTRQQARLARRQSRSAADAPSGESTGHAGADGTPPPGTKA